MTKEEAISMLERLRFPEPWEPKLSKGAEEALDMGISALSKEDNTMEWLENEDGSYECSKCHITRSGLISGVFNFCPNCGRKAVQR